MSKDCLYLFLARVDTFICLHFSNNYSVILDERFRKEIQNLLIISFFPVIKNDD